MFCPLNEIYLLGGATAWMGDQIQIPRVVKFWVFFPFFPSFFQGDNKACRTAILA